jgi:hypothetical protein
LDPQAAQVFSLNPKAMDESIVKVTKAKIIDKRLWTTSKCPFVVKFIKFDTKELLSVTSFAMENYFRVKIEKWYCEYFSDFFFIAGFYVNSYHHVFCKLYENIIAIFL